MFQCPTNPLPGARGLPSFSKWKPAGLLFTSSIIAILTIQSCKADLAGSRKGTELSWISNYCISLIEIQSKLKTIAFTSNCLRMDGHHGISSSGLWPVDLKMLKAAKTSKKQIKWVNQMIMLWFIWIEQTHSKIFISLMTIIVNVQWWRKWYCNVNEESNTKHYRSLMIFTTEPYPFHLTLYCNLQ